MTNLDILLQAARCSAFHTSCKAHLDPDEAWRRWSAQSGVYDQGARLLFEYKYAQCQRQSLWWQVLSGASTSGAWRRILDFVRADGDISGDRS